MAEIDLGQIIQIIANLGVIVGIIFLIIEIKQTNDQAKAQSRFNYYKTRIELVTIAATDTNLVEIFNKKIRDEELSTEEALRIRLFTSALLTGWEYEYGEYKAGRLSLEDLDLPTKRVVFHGPMIDIHDTWENRPVNDEFRKFIEEKIISK